MNSEQGAYTKLLNEYRQFLNEHRRDPSTRAVDPHEQRLGRWLHNQRDSLRRRGYTATERTALLDEVNPVWRYQDGETADDAFFNRLAEYARFCRGERLLGEHLGYWIQRQRSLAKQGELPSNRAAWLDAVNPHWRGPKAPKGDDASSRRVAEYARFLAKHRRDPSSHATDPAERSIGQWVSRQRAASKQGRLSSHRSTLMDEANPSWQHHNDPTRDYGFARRLAEYSQVHAGNRQLGTSLGSWIRRQRYVERQGNLSRERASQLDSVDPHWREAELAPNDWGFTDRLAEYAQFRDGHGRDPSANAADPAERSIGRWIAQQRRKGHQGTLSSPRIALLDQTNPHWRHQYGRTAYDKLNRPGTGGGFC